MFSSLNVSELEENYVSENFGGKYFSRNDALMIGHIREKLEINPKEPKYLKVIWGVGYKIEIQN